MEQIFSILRATMFSGAGQTAALIFARILPVVALTPLFGGNVTPRRFRLGVALTLTLGILPAFVGQFGTEVDAASFALLFAKESVIGLTLAVFVIIVLETLAAAGSIIDLAREATIANIYDRVTQRQDSILAVFLLWLILALFFTVGGVQLLLLAVRDSFDVIGPYDPLPARWIDASASAMILGLVAQLFATAVQLAAPVIVMLLVLEVSLALVSRAAPQFDVFFFGKPIKGLLGLLVLFLVLGYGLQDVIAGTFDLLLDWVSGRPVGGGVT